MNLKDLEKLIFQVPEIGDRYFSFIQARAQTKMSGLIEDQAKAGPMIERLLNMKERSPAAQSMVIQLSGSDVSYEFKSECAKKIHEAANSARHGDLAKTIELSSAIGSNVMRKRLLLDCCRNAFLQSLKAEQVCPRFDVELIIESKFAPSIKNALLEFIVLLDSSNETYAKNEALEKYVYESETASFFLRCLFEEKYNDVMEAYKWCMKKLSRCKPEDVKVGKKQVALLNIASLALYLDHNIYFTLGDNAFGKPIVRRIVGFVHEALRDDEEKLGGTLFCNLVTTLAGLLRTLGAHEEAAELIRKTYERFEGNFHISRLLISGGCKMPQRGMSDQASAILINLKAELVAEFDEKYIRTVAAPDRKRLFDVGRIVEEFDKERSFDIFRSLTIVDPDVWNNRVFRRTVLRSNSGRTADMVKEQLDKPGVVEAILESPDANAVLQYYLRYGPDEKLKTLLEEIGPDIAEGTDLAALRVTGNAHLRLDQIEQAAHNSGKILAIFADRIVTSGDLFDMPRYIVHCDLLNRALYRMDIEDIYSRVPQPKKLKGIVVALPYYAHHINFSPLLALIRLKEQGYAVLNLTEGCLPYEETGVAELDRYLGCFTQGTLQYKYDKTSRDTDDLFFEWVIDWENMDIRCLAPGLEKTNMFQQFLERLCIYKRGYTIDISSPYMAQLLAGMVKRADNLLQLYYDMHDATKEMDLPVRYLVNEAYAAPMGTIRFACADHGKEFGTHCIFALNAYESYYGKTADGLSHALALEDMTFHDEMRAPNLAVPEKFHAWAENHDLDDALERAKVFTASKRKTELSDEAAQLRQRLIEDREAGKFNVCLIGKVVVDLGAFRLYDGPAHVDMKDWLRHTIEVARANPNVNLLIKPHPHELNQGVSFYLSETLADLADAQNLPENVIFLGHSWYSITDLVDFVDLVTMWNGTSCLELGVLGVPTIMCSHYSKVDYPIGFATPESRENYEDIISGKTPVTLPENAARLSAGLIDYIETPEVSIPYEYSLRYSSNKKLRVPKMRNDLIKQYFDNGDPHVDELAARFFRH